MDKSVKDGSRVPADDYQVEPAVPLTRVMKNSYARFSDRVAVVDGERQLTYADLFRRATAIARGFASLGTEPGDRVALIGKNSLEWFEVDHACYVGGLRRLAPITRLHPTEIRDIIEDAQAEVLVADAEWLASAGTGWLPDYVKHVLHIGGDGTGGISLESVVAAAEAHPLPEIPDTADSWIMYTSGSTGRPKGVRCTGPGLGAMLRNTLAEMPDLTSASVAIHTAPLSHFSGAVALAIFAVGGANVVHSEFNPSSLAEALNEGSVDVLPLVPTQINLLTEHLEELFDEGKNIDVSSLTYIPYAGSAIAPDRLLRAKQIFGDTLLQFYGSTEAPLPVTALQPEDHLDTTDGQEALPRLASAGRRNRYVEMEIRDLDGRAVPADVTGEILVRGEQVMGGYWNQPGATSEVMTDDGWIHTGDVGYFDEAGYLFIVDRKKDMIISGGFNVYPREIENVIAPMNGVQDVAVVGIPSERWGEAITAYIVVQSGALLSEDDIFARCRDSLAGYKVPKSVVFVEELPRSATGKILKRKIVDELWEGRSRRV